MITKNYLIKGGLMNYGSSNLIEFFFNNLKSIILIIFAFNISKLQKKVKSLEERIERIEIRNNSNYFRGE